MFTEGQTVPWAEYDAEHARFTVIFVNSHMGHGSLPAFALLYHDLRHEV